jgi:hypothetical protein
MLYIFNLYIIISYLGGVSHSLSAYRVVTRKLLLNMDTNTLN